MGDLPEDPRITECRSTDHNTVATRFAEHAGGVLGCQHVPIADDWNLHRFFYLADDVPIGLPAETLSSSATMYSDCLYANAFSSTRKGNSRQSVRIPPGPHFHGDRHIDGLHD